MKMFYNSLLILFIFIQSPGFSQEAGKILSKQEAENLFGKVTESKLIHSTELSRILQVSDQVFMFQILNESIIILGNNRQVLFPSGININPSEVFHLFSRSKVEELLQLGSSNDVFVEKRGDILTITCGEFTLEFSIPCPPYCG